MTIGSPSRRTQRLILLLASLVLVACAAYLATCWIAWSVPRPTAQISIRSADGIAVPISLWYPAGDRRPRSGVVMLHGDGGAGHPLYALLADRLRTEGFCVAVPTLRGYRGGTRLPAPFDANRWDPMPDIAATYARMRQDPGVDPSRVFVIGLSLGGGYALLYGLADSTVAGVASMSRLDMEDRLRTWPNYYEECRVTFAGAFGLDAPLPAGPFEEFAKSQIFAFERAKPALRSPAHPPILFTVGTLERASDRRWLRSYVAQAAGDVCYHEFAGATHTMNVQKGPGGMIFRDPRIIPEVASTFRRWTEGDRPSSG